MLTPGANAALPAASRLEVAVAYDRQHADVICLLLDVDDHADGDHGVVLFSQPECAGGAVRLDHVADRLTVDLRRLPPGIQRVLVVANADTAQTIDQTGGVSVAIIADSKLAASARILAPPPFATVQLVELYRRNGAWKVRVLGDGYADGLEKLLNVHGVETTSSLEPAAAAVPPPSGAKVNQPRQWPPPPTPAPAHESVGAPTPFTQATRVHMRKPDLPSSGCVKLAKGEGISLVKQGQSLTIVTLGLGWDPARRGASIDLDAGCVMMDANGNKIEAVYFGHLNSKDGSIRHSGDNLTGKGGGDDERIRVDLRRVPPNVQMLAFTVNSFGGQKFSEVANAFCRLLDHSDLLDNTGVERVRYDLSDSRNGSASPFGNHKGVVIATVERIGNTWAMTARGDLGGGRTYKGLLPIIEGYFGGNDGDKPSGGRKKFFGR